MSKDKPDKKEILRKDAAKKLANIGGTVPNMVSTPRPNWETMRSVEVNEIQDKDFDFEVELAATKGGVILITENGEPKAYLVSIERYEELSENIKSNQLPSQHPQEDP